MKKCLTPVERDSSSPNSQPLTPQQINQWRDSGYILIDGLLPKKLMDSAVAEATHVLSRHKIQDFGSGGMMEFPAMDSPNCNSVTLFPSLINAASQLLQIDPFEVRLTQSDVWPKWGIKPGVYDELANVDQRMHCDYGNNTLVHPPSWENPEAVAMLVYLSNSEECGGGTNVVPREGKNDPHYKWPLIAMPGYGGIPFLNDRTAVENYMEKNHPEFYKFRQGLYEREVGIKFNVGTVLIYRHDIWHRGTPVNEGKLRIVMNLSFRKSSATWITNWNCGWAKNMYYGVVEKIIANSDLLQRSALGFPPVDSDYWNNETINAVSCRYAPFGFDPSPYYKALKQKRKEEHKAML